MGRRLALERCVRAGASTPPLVMRFRLGGTCSGGAFACSLLCVRVLACVELKNKKGAEPRFETSYRVMCVYVGGWVGRG